MKIQLAKPEHEVLYQDLIRLVGRHGDKVDAFEMLAIAANMLGKLVAMQDQRTITPKMALELVAKNIEEGNRQVLEMLSNTVGEA